MNLCNPIPGGSVYRVTWDDEVIEVQLPPVGYTIDRIPDLKTGKPSLELVKCEVLFENMPVEQQKWKRSELPADWKIWRKDERLNKKIDANYTNPMADAFRQQEWTRKVNGVWIVIGNNVGKPSEYVYMTGQMYDYFNWWKQDFGYPKFRFTYCKLFYAMQYGKDHHLIHGLTLSTNRRYGKTSISMHNLWYEQSFKPNRRAGLQAQTRQDAADKFAESFVYGWKRQPDFFKPMHDYNSTQKSELSFIKPTPKGKSALLEMDSDDTNEGLNSIIDFRETKATSYDSYKLHDYAMEEPGKWENEDVYDTLDVIIPDTRDGFEKIGFIFAPTTIEELEKGGDKFIEMFEDSRPSLMKKNENGKTDSNLISLFIPAQEGTLFDEYGRSVIHDPAPNEVIIGEDGKRIFMGALTKIMNDRKPKKNNYQRLVKEIRKYPCSWDEAKMMTADESPFNIMILQDRLDKLEAMKGNLYSTGNFEWKDKVDGDVIFVVDDLAGRWNLGYHPDTDGAPIEGDVRITNRIGEEWVYDDQLQESKKVYYPLNNRLFRLGADPIRYTKTDDPRASKAGVYVWQMYDPQMDLGVPKAKWKSHNFIAEYLYRPNEFSILGEDVIKALRFFGCSIAIEEDVTNLRQHLEGRGYGRHVLFKRDFSDTVIKQDATDNYKGLNAVDEVTNAWLQRFVSNCENHGHRYIFPRLIKQMMKFTVKTKTKWDAVVGAGYALLASEAKVPETIEEQKTDVGTVFPLYDQSGSRSQIQQREHSKSA